MLKHVAKKLLDLQKFTTDILSGRVLPENGSRRTEEQLIDSEDDSLVHRRRLELVRGVKPKIRESDEIVDKIFSKDSYNFKKQFN